MWIMTPFGIIMPSAIPATVDLGSYELQVRARDRRALKHFKRTYMWGLEASKIVATPTMDYEFRFYTTRSDFAEGMARAIDDIREPKFKPTAKDADLHHLYNTVWYVVAKHYDAVAVGGEGPKGRKNA